MFVLRIHHADSPRRGPFAGFNMPAWQASCKAREIGAFDPYVHDDFYIPGYHCGFPSLDAYLQWFRTPEVREVLWQDPDWIMQAYDAPNVEVAPDGIQCAFDLDTATPLEILPREVLIHATPLRRR